MGHYHAKPKRRGWVHVGRYCQTKVSGLSSGEAATAKPNLSAPALVLLHTAYWLLVIKLEQYSISGALIILTIG